MMRRYFFLLSVLCVLASCTHNATAPQSEHPSVVAIRDTVDFGTNPLWRESDTTVIIHLNSRDTITSVLLLDSDWSIMSPTPIIPKIDSTITLSFMYQPRSVSSHAGQVMLRSGSDTAAIVHLIGQTSPFERRVGDSYIFESSSGALDSVVVAQLPLRFSATLKTNISRELERVSEDSIEDWITGWIGSSPFDIRLPVSSGHKFSNTFSGFDSTTFGEYGGMGAADTSGDTILTIGSVQFAATLIEASSSFTSYLRPTYRASGGTFSASFIQGIGMFGTIRDWYWQTTTPNTHGEGAQETYRLIRFHLLK